MTTAVIGGVGQCSVAINPLSPLQCLFNLQPLSSSTLTSPSLRSNYIFYPKQLARLQISNRQGGRVLIAVVRISGTCVESDDLHLSDDNREFASKEATFDIQLPRRSLLVQFTCDACGERTKRLINRLAYEKGTVFLQCAGCLVYHKFVDNLGLVVEYDLREELDADSDDNTE